jgi:hypothetical protein
MPATPKASPSAPVAHGASTYFTSGGNNGGDLCSSGGGALMERETLARKGGTRPAEGTERTEAPEPIAQEWAGKPERARGASVSVGCTYARRNRSTREEILSNLLFSGEDGSRHARCS